MARTVGTLAVAVLVLCSLCLAGNSVLAAATKDAAPEAVSETWTVMADDTSVPEERTERFGLDAGDDEFLIAQEEAEALGDDVQGEGEKEEAPDAKPAEPSTLWDGMVRLGGILGWIVLLGGMWLGSLYYNQEGVLYHPEQPKGYRSPSDIPAEAGLSSPAARDPPLPFKSVFLATEDGVRLHAWMVHATDPELRKRVPTVVFLHGNAGSELVAFPDAGWRALPSRPVLASMPFNDSLSQPP